MKLRTIVVFLAACVPGLVSAQVAQSYQCTFGDLQRRVQIFTDPGVTVPCEVHYFKDTEAPGEKQVLWSATSDASYCDAKTSEFIAKLEGWGWSCSAGDTGMPPSEPMPAAEAADSIADGADEMADSDDTETLAPAAE
ncbi:MAG: hypothetical protein KJO82_01700 [Gammaproteobacteria bacterium]|nr:hypothetical protein [Gammaproteobacteria bacterium]